MRYQIVSLIAVAIATVSAAPAQVEKRETYTYDKKGNVNIIFSDNTINIGDVSIDDIMDEMWDACSPDALCDSTGFELKGQIMGGGNSAVSNVKVSVEPDGAYGPDVRKDLLNTLKSVVKEVAKCETKTHKSDCGNPMVYCPSKSTKVTQCTVPEFWGVAKKNKDGNNAPAHIDAAVSAEVDGDGFCETFSTVASAVAGAVNGAAGGAFSLLGLVCQ